VEGAERVWGRVAACVDGDPMGLVLEMEITRRFGEMGGSVSWVVVTFWFFLGEPQAFCCGSGG